jgi:hypothetical protein
MNAINYIITLLENRNQSIGAKHYTGERPVGNNGLADRASPPLVSCIII